MREIYGAIIPLGTYVNFRRDSWDTEKQNILTDSWVGRQTLEFGPYQGKKSNRLSPLAFHLSSVHSLSHVCLCNPMDCSMPGLPVQHQLPEFSQTQVHQVSDANQPSHPLLSPSPLTFNLSKHQGLFKWVCSLHQVAKVLEFQLQHQSFQWIFRTNFLPAVQGTLFI